MNAKEQQFTNIIKEHERTIYTVCYMFSSDSDEVNDLYQDILVRLWQGFDAFEGKSDIRTWIYRVSLNYCINFSNRQKKQRERLNLDTDFLSEGRSMEKNLQIKQLYKRINTLGLVDRSVVLLWLEGLSYEEIGAILGISVKNVSFKLVRIKEQLKKCLTSKKKNRMGINIEKELQTLKSEYDLFKEELGKQKTVNEKFFKSLRKRPAMAISKEIRDRMWGDILTVPMIIVICIHINWPILFALLVSLWALADLGASLWVSRKLGMENLLNGDVRTVTEKIAGYRKFYAGTLIASIVPLTAMLTYIFMRLYAQANDAATVRLITVAGIVSIAVGIVITLLQYKKHMRRCNELLDEFRE